MLTGSMVAMVTPMGDDGSVDWEGLARLVNHHVEQGTDAIVSVGTTGESATLDHHEHIPTCKRCRSGQTEVEPVTERLLAAPL